MYTFDTKGNDVEMVFYIFKVFKGRDAEGFAIGKKHLFYVVPKIF